MTPTVPEVVKVAERRTAAAVKIEQAHLAFVEDARAVRETILLQKLRIPIPQPADVEFVQVAVPPVERGLNCEMELP
jgi:hypothetical protein